MMGNSLNKGKNSLRKAYKRLSEKYESGSKFEDIGRVSDFSDNDVFDEAILLELSYQNAEYMEEKHNKNMSSIIQIIDDCRKSCQAQRRTDRSFLIEQVINTICNSEELFVNDDVIKKVFDILAEGEKESELEKLCLSEKIPGMDDMVMILPEQIEALAEAYKRCGYNFDTLPDIMLTDSTFMTTYFEKNSSLEPMDDEKRMVEVVNSLCTKEREK